MRNLKKFLALILAMVMAMSMMLTANAAGFDDYPDKDSITPEFSEAVEVLTGLGVFTGDDGGFRPQGEITRAEVAAVIYRLATGDVTDAQVKVYADYGNYVDVTPDKWYAGYVGYCTNAGYIKGQAGNRFNPSGKVTGYQALAMILRAVGYDKNHEFEGASWQVNVASLSKQLGVTQHVVNANFETTLNYAATREVIADLLFMTATTVPTVTYTTSLQYNDKESLVSTNFNPTLGQKTFGLTVSGWTNTSPWGRPVYRWLSGGSFNNTYTGIGSVPANYAYQNPIGHPVYADAGTTVAVIEANPSLEFDTTMLECDVADALNIPVAEQTFRLFVNGDYNLNTDPLDPTDPNYRIQANDVVTKVGGQGRHTEFYYKTYSPWVGNCPNTVVMIDTMLARVTAVTESKVDKNDHVIVPAQLEVTIYDGPNKTNVVGGSNDSSSNRIISKPMGNADNWAYSKGQMVLIQGVTNKMGRTSSSQRESAAFETDKIMGSNRGIIYEGSGVNVLQVAESFQGKQTIVSTNTGKHTVDGKPYDDQLCLFLDRAGTATNTTFSWYLDTRGNLIGIGDANAVNFGVITSIYAAFGTGETDTTGAVKAVATVKMADGSVKTVTIDRFLMSLKDTTFATTAGNNWPADTATDGEAGCDTVAATALQGGANTIDLRPVYDTVTNSPLSVTDPNPAFTPVNAGNAGWLYLAPAAVTNTNAHFALNAPTNDEPETLDSFGILYNHMFEFVVASDNSVIAVEVAGVNQETAASSAVNTGLYVGNANGNVTSTQGGKLYKNTAWLTLDVTGTPATANASVYLDDNTQIMVRVGNWLTSTVINTYNGVKSLPGDIVIPQNTQVDWADTDGDGRADYVYINQSEIPSVIDYALFYFNNGAATWDAATGVGTVEGYLNGKAQTITFASEQQYWTVVNSTNSYLGHLFALQLTNGIVSDVMITERTNTVTDTTTDLLKYLDYDATTTSSSWDNRSGQTLVSFQNNIGLSSDYTSKFQVGVPANPNATNPYSVTTAAVYYYDTRDIDVDPTIASTHLDYARVSDGYRVIAYDQNNVELASYWIAPNATIEGELEWLNSRANYVTMVYESNNANAIMELYITPVPDVTPSDEINAPAARSVQPGPNVSNAGNNSALLSAGIKSGTRDLVVIGSVQPSAALVTALDVGAANPATQLYFPFTVANGNSATLEIRNAANNDLAFSMTGGPFSTNGLDGAGDAHCFVVDFANVTGGGYQPGIPLRAGYTYNFTITATIGGVNVTLSSGSFTMGW